MARKKNMQRRKVILRNAFALVRRYGMAKVSLQMIADDSDISKSLLQSYYPHKTLLINDILHNMMTTIFSQLKKSGVSGSDEYAAMHVFINSILEIGVRDSGLFDFLRSVIENNESLDRWVQLISTWLKEEGIQDAFGNDNEFRIGLTYMVAGGGNLYVKRGELGISSVEITDIMVRNFLSTFLRLSGKKVDRIIAESHLLIDKIDVDKVHGALNRMFADDSDIVIL